MSGFQKYLPNFVKKIYSAKKMVNFSILFQKKELLCKFKTE